MTQLREQAVPKTLKKTIWIKNIQLWWARSDSNRGPRDYESPALTAELRARYLMNTDLQPFFLQPQKCFCVPHGLIIRL